MAWSLLNSMIADKVKALLDEQSKSYPPEVKRFYSREQAEAIIHAVIWGYASREDSTAGCYAADNLFRALGLKWWTFDEDHAVHHRELGQRLWIERHSPAEASSLSPDFSAADANTNVDVNHPSSNGKPATAVTSTLRGTEA